MSTTEGRVSQLLAEAAVSGQPPARVSQLLAEAVVAGDVARISQLFVHAVVGPDLTAPDPPSVEVLYVGARIARFRTSPISPGTVFHAATRYRVRTADLAQTVWESPEIVDPASLIEYLIPEPALPPAMDLVVEARHRQSFGVWSDYGPPTPFRTKAATEIPQPPSWLLPAPGSTHIGVVHWQLAASPGADANYVYRVEMRVNGGAWAHVKDGDGALVGTIDLTPHPAGAQIEFRALARPSAAETAEPSDWAAGPTISVLAIAGSAAAPVAGPVRLRAPGFVELEAQPYANPLAVHTATRWEVQLAGGDWSAPVFDSGFQSVHLLSHPAVPVLDPDADYEFRVSYAFADSTLTPPSAAYRFRPQGNLIDFTDPGQLAGLPGADLYEIVDYEGTFGGKALRPKATGGFRTLVFTNLRSVSGLSARFRVPWEWPMYETPIVLRGMLRERLQFLFTWDPEGNFGYVIQLDAVENEIVVRRRLWGNEWSTVLAPRVKVQLDADRWYRIDVFMLVGRVENYVGFNLDAPPPVLTSYGPQEHPIIVVRLNGQTMMVWADYGYQAPGIGLGPGRGVLPSMIPRTGFVGIRTMLGEGAPLFDWIAAVDGIAVEDVIPSPTWVHPRPGEPALGSLHLEVEWESPAPGEFVFEYEDETGMWHPLSPQGPASMRVVDVATWPARTGVRVRVRAVYDIGTGPRKTAWAVSEPFPVNMVGAAFLDTSELPSGPPAGLLSPMWETSQDWAVAGQSDGTVIPAQILRLRQTPPGGRVSALAYLPIGTVRNAEMLLELRCFSDTARIGAVLCASGTAAAGDWSGYFVSVSRAGGRIERITNGNRATLRSDGAMGLRTGPPWMLLVRRENGVISAKTWQKHTAPPADWQVSVTDDTFESGMWGVGVQGGDPGWTRGVRLLSVVDLDVAAPPPPTWLIDPVIEDCIDGDYTLAWTPVEDPMGGAVSYAVGYAPESAPGEPSAPTTILATDLAGTSHPFAPQSVAPGTYRFFVRACNAAGCSAWAATTVEVVAQLEEPGLLVLYMGEQDGEGVYRFDTGYEDGVVPVESVLVPNWIAPAGIAADVLFTTLYVTLTWSMQAIVRVTPMLNGRRLDDEAAELHLGAQNPAHTATFEIRLSEAVRDAMGAEVARSGLRGTWFTFEIRTVGLLGCADLWFEGAEVEYTVLRETHPGITFFSQAQQPPQLASGQVVLFGGEGSGRVYEFDQGATDDGAAVPAVAEPNAVAPAGVGGECVFGPLWIVVTHRNAAPVALKLTPLVDFRPLEKAIVREDLTVSDEIVLQPSPDGWLTEVIEVGLSVPIEAMGAEVGRVKPRGAWFSFRIETVAPLADDDDVILEAAEVEYTVVRESQEKVDA